MTGPTPLFVQNQRPDVFRLLRTSAADLFQSTLKSITEDDTTTRVIILQLKNARDIDATACLALQQLHDYLKSSDNFFPNKPNR